MFKRIFGNHVGTLNMGWCGKLYFKLKQNRGMGVGLVDKIKLPRDYPMFWMHFQKVATVHC